MLERLPRNRRNVALAILGALVLWFAWTIRAVLNPLLIGYLLAYILHPIVQRLQASKLAQRLSPRMSRRGAVNLTFALGALGALLMVLALAQQTNSLVRDVLGNEAMRERVSERYAELHGWLEETLPEEAIPERATVQQDLKALLAHVESWFQQSGNKEMVADAAGVGLEVTGDVLARIKAVLNWFIGIGGLIVLVPLYTYYLLFELERIHGFFARYLPKRDRAHISDVGSQVGEVLANFFRGRLAVCFLKGLLTAVGLLIAGVPYAFLLGMGSGFLSLIPAVGTAIGFVGAVVLSLVVAGDSFLGALVAVGVVFAIAELVEGYVLLPKILGDSLGLHPLVVLFSLLAGGAALGLFGVLVALPLTAVIVILVRELVLPALERFADEDDDDDPGRIIVTGAERTD